MIGDDPDIQHRKCDPGKNVHCELVGYTHSALRNYREQGLSWGANSFISVLTSNSVRSAPVGQISVDGFAIGHFVVGDATIGLGVGVLSFKQRTALLLFLLDVLEDNHERLHSARDPVACPGSICDPFGSNAILILP